MAIDNSTNRNIPVFPPPDHHSKPFNPHPKVSLFHRSATALMLLFLRYKEQKYYRPDLPRPDKNNDRPDSDIEV
jgi:hypothetical protein